MSIQIIGSNGNFIKYIIENKIENLFDDKILNYKLLKNKYYNKILTSKNDSDFLNQAIPHYIKELINIFSNYNDDYTLQQNINKFIIFLNEIIYNSDNFNIGNLYLLVNRENNELFEKLTNSIFKLNESLKNSNFKYTSNPFNDLTTILNGLEIKMTNQNNKNNYLINKIINKILNKINDYDDIIKSINNMYKIKLNKDSNKDLNSYLNTSKTKYNIDFIIYLILELDNIIIIYKILKSNINKLDNNINSIIELINNLYILIKNG